MLSKRPLFPRTLAFLAAAMLCFSANAVDVTQTLIVTESEKPVLTVKTDYFGMNAEDMKTLEATGNKMLKRVKSGGKFTDKNGAYKVVMKQAASQDGQPIAGLSFEDILFSELSLREVNRVMRASERFFADMITVSEKNVAAGKKKAWGK